MQPFLAPSLLSVAISSSSLLPSIPALLNPSPSSPLLSSTVLPMLVSQPCWSCSLLSSSLSATTTPPAWRPRESTSSLPLCRCAAFPGGSWPTRSSVSGRCQETTTTLCQCMYCIICCAVYVNLLFCCCCCVAQCYSLKLLVSW